MLLLQEFDLEIRDKKGIENLIAYYLSRLKPSKQKMESPIKENFSDKQLFAMKSLSAPWYANFINYLASGVMPYEFSQQQRKKFLADMKYYFWENPFLYEYCLDKIIKRCVPEEEMTNILSYCHSSPYSGHFGAN